MAGFLGVSVILAELASATTNGQPAIVQNQTAAADVAVPLPENETAPATQQEPVAESIPATHPDSLTYGVNEVVKMYRGGVKTDVLLTYIETSNFPYQLSSREILYLNQVGLPSEIVNAMIRRDHQVEVARAGANQQVQQTLAAPAPPMPPAPVSYTQPSVVVVQQPAPQVHYVSATPTFSAPSCAAPNVNPNVTVIGSRYGSTFYNGCYYSPFSCSPARSYYDARFGWHGYSVLYNSDCGTRFAYDGYRGGFGRSGVGRRFGRF